MLCYKGGQKLIANSDIRNIAWVVFAIHILQHWSVSIQCGIIRFPQRSSSPITFGFIVIAAVFVLHYVVNITLFKHMHTYRFIAALIRHFRTCCWAVITTKLLWKCLSVSGRNDHLLCWNYISLFSWVVQLVLQSMDEFTCWDSSL